VEDRWPLPGSDRTAVAGFTRTETELPTDDITVGLWLGGKQSGVQETAQALLAKPIHERTYLSLAQLNEKFGPDPNDVDKVTAFAKKHGLEPQAFSSDSRLLSLKVSVQQSKTLFNADLKLYTSAGGHQYRGRTGAISLLKEDFAAANPILAVFGLDNRCQAKHFSVETAVSPGQYPPVAYGFPVNSQASPQPIPHEQGTESPLTGNNISVGVIGFGGSISAATLARLVPHAQIAVAPPQPITQLDGRFNTETINDVQIIHTCAPNANITVYAFDRTDLGWISGLNSILQSESIPSILSISWGWPEISNANPENGPLWTDASINALEDILAALTLRGVSIVVSTGDSGPQVCYPSSSAFVLACGGTTVVPNGSEVVWCSGLGSSAGGISTLVAMPDWQKQASIQCRTNIGTVDPAKRSVPDVAASASYAAITGTSAATPLWAALLALANEYLSILKLPSAGHINSLLYEKNSPLQSSCRDIETQNNAHPPGSTPFFSATPGWDACTGWGSPKVIPFIQALADSEIGSD
jgi:kumamolisin